MQFVKKVKLSHDTFEFYFKRESFFLYKPGQYISLHLKEKTITLPTYSFTISSSPSEKKYITITTKVNNKSPFKNRLFKLSANEKISYKGPFGEFTLDTNAANQLFLAGGIGVTPFHSMITYAANKKLSNNLYLFVSFTESNEVVYFDVLQNIAKRHSNIKIIYTITNQSEDKSWDGERGRITTNLINKYLDVKQIDKIMIVGPLKMTIAMEELVSTLDLKNDNVQIEVFSGY